MTIIEHRKVSYFPACTRSIFAGLLLIAGCAAAFIVLEPAVAFLVGCWLCLTLIIVASDLDRFIIPNWATAGVAVLGLFHAFALARHPIAIGVVLVPLERAIITFCCAALFGRIFKWLTDRDGLGFGDVKLCAALALWLPPYDLVIMIELASFAALGVAGLSRLRRDEMFEGGAIPFAAFLAPAGWLVFMWGATSEALRPWHLPFG